VSTMQERIDAQRAADRRHAELMALPVKARCECTTRISGSSTGADTDPRCPDHGVRVRATRSAVLTDDELDQLRQDMGYDTYER
jgi:hypothetical protein